jgi:outer membrane lipopolysaccharide assembly protein LptE/RlpB
MRHSAVTLAVLLAVVAGGCGYHTAGHIKTLPEDIHTIAVPAFINQSPTYRVEQRLTAAVVRELVTRTNYHVINQPDQTADATLQGIVINTVAVPATYDSQTGRAASVMVALAVKVSLTDRHGKVLYQNPAYSFRDEYQVSRELTSFFEEDSPAWDRMSRAFARTLVSNILEGF